MGAGVYPLKYMLETPAASAVRNMEPTLCVLRMLCRSTVISLMAAGYTRVVYFCHAFIISPDTIPRAVFTVRYTPRACVRPRSYGLEAFLGARKQHPRFRRPRNRPLRRARPRHLDAGSRLGGSSADTPRHLHAPPASAASQYHAPLTRDVPLARRDGRRSLRLRPAVVNTREAKDGVL